MMVGHSLLAFAVLAVLARAAGAEPRRALVAGIVAAAFAAVPDADMAYALSGLLGAEFDGVFSVTTAFWSASTVVHRAMTHSLVVAPVAALGFALVTVRGRYAREAAVAGGVVLAAMVWVAVDLHGLLGLVVVLAFASFGVTVALAVRALTDFDARTTFLLALFGLASHPWGDLFTGDPPAMLWPLDATLFAERVALAPDPTLHLLGAFALELATVALAVLVVVHLGDFSPRVYRRSLAGVAYGGAVFFMPPPTLDVSYHFVFSILALGTVLAAPDLGRARLLASVRRLSRQWDADRALSAVTTGLAAVGFALLAYGILYVAG
ncbi:metal-dependent hydrolase [Haloarchaeobius sp. HRN-SO-5]|uniref:metal-dependent hydrolase n=1 Tax=Haloarchaeobius sp. HRN-SO-5 TaxID=3446118 RepID=UPI003EBB2792